MEIKSILIANRGEIALRALRTIKEMGKKAICVYSEADKDALYLKYADASICIGKAAPKAILIFQQLSVLRRLLKRTQFFRDMAF